MKILYEYRPNLMRVGDPVLVPKDETKEGFRSYFGFTEEGITKIANQKSTANLKTMEVYCDELLLDVDNPEQLDYVVGTINNLGWGYHYYTTGNRGCHIHVSIEPILDSNAPYSIKQFLTSVGLGRDVIDHSPIRHAGIFRTEGKAHRKTGKQKTLVRSRQGSRPVIPIIKEPEVEIDVNIDGTEHDGYMYSYLLMSKVGVGERYTRIYALIQHGLRAGESIENITQDIHNWNDNLDEPHTHNMVDIYCERIARSIR